MSVITRTNRATNPVPANGTGWGTSSLYTKSYEASRAGRPAMVYTKVGTGYWVTYGRRGGSIGAGTGTMPTTTAEVVAVTPGTTVQIRMDLGTDTLGTDGRIGIRFFDAAYASVGYSETTPVAMQLSTWQPFSLTAVAPAGATSYWIEWGVAMITGDTVGGEKSWAGRALMGEPNEYFDGSYVNAGSAMYAWTGAANASSSTQTTYTPVLSLVAKTDAPCARVEITITDLTPTSNAVTVWRTADGKRKAVRGARKRDMVGSDFLIDYEVPLRRTVTYDVEVAAGINAQAGGAPATIVVDSDHGFIQDPLNPGTAVSVYGGVSPNGEAALIGRALKAFEYGADMSIVSVLGSPDPVALMGQRMAQSGVDLSMVTEAAQEAADLRNLIREAPLLLVRPLPEWGASLPGLCYVASSSPQELPINEAWGGNLIEWKLVGNLVAAPTMNVLVPLWTYGDVKALWATYQQAQTALAGETYLDLLKSPSGV